MRHTAPVVVHPQAFLTRRAGPRGRAGAAGLGTVCRAGGDSPRERERESQVTPRGNQFLEKCARRPCSEISRALCQGCGARSWALGWSILVARREKKMSGSLSL